MKHRVNRMMAVAILTGGLHFAGTGASAATFKDLSKDFWAKDEISYLVEHEVIKGYPDGTFKPNQKVTRAQFSAFVARALSTDFLPNKYNVPLNVNPAATLFHLALKKPYEAQQLFVDNKFNISLLTKDVQNGELVEVKEVTRVNGQTEFLLKFKTQLKAGANNSLLKDGENQLYVVIKRNGYMDFKIVSLAKDSQLTKDQAPSLTEKEALGLFIEAKNSYWDVVSGGEGQRNEERFGHEGKYYRYMAESLNTMEKLKEYLGKIYTPEQLENLIKELGIIKHKGVLAQPDADGGSLLNWKKAKIKEISSSDKGKHFEIDVPIGDSSDYEVLIGELQYVQEPGTWLVNRLEQRVTISQ